MSPDDIFAAQFWPWPDPAIKRDTQGRVLFVNAAFLALYGGQVENWRGNAIGGWPAPQMGSAVPYRFETRIPATDGSEQVYDWMEQTLADGNAFALARNVTIFAQAPQPDPAASLPPELPPVHQDHDLEAAAMQTSAYDAPPAQTEPAYSEFAEETYAAPEAEPAPALTEYAAEPALEQQAPMEAAPQIEASDIPMPYIEIPEIDIPSDTNYAMTETLDAQQNISAAVETHVERPTYEPAPAAQPEAAREFERRALPIEDESAVLGNNWRDAVIAKAVGAEGIAAAEAADTGVEPEPEMAPAAEAGSQIRILLAEDNAINALLTRTLLEAEGHSVDTVEDGVLAVEAMKTSSYDLIFMDMRMPNMDGLEATRKIRSLSNVGRSLPIIALTANAFDDDRNACFDSGMNDFMTKPVSAEELSEKVRDWTSAEAKERLANAA